MSWIKKWKKGQAVVESILLAVILVLLMSLVLPLVSGEEGIVNRIVSAPFQYIKGMARSGTWTRYEGNKDLKNHPHLYDNHVAQKGQSVQ